VQDQINQQLVLKTMEIHNDKDYVHAIKEVRMVPILRKVKTHTNF